MMAAIFKIKSVWLALRVIQILEIAVNLVLLFPALANGTVHVTSVPGKRVQLKATDMQGLGVGCARAVKHTHHLLQQLREQPPRSRKILFQK